METHFENFYPPGFMWERHVPIQLLAEINFAKSERPVPRDKLGHPTFFRQERSL